MNESDQKFNNGKMRLWRSTFNQKGDVHRIEIIVKIWQATRERFLREQVT